jgi:hypothetical protein
MKINKNDVLALRYRQPLNGNTGARFVKVVKIRDMHKNKAVQGWHYRYIDHLYGRFKRTKHMMTCVDTAGHYRHIYAERAAVCKPFLGKLRFALRKFFGNRKDQTHGQI